MGDFNKASQKAQFLATGRGINCIRNDVVEVSVYTNCGEGEPQ